MGPYQQALLSAYYSMSDAYEMYSEMNPLMRELVDNPYPSRPRCAVCESPNLNGTCLCPTVEVTRW